MNMKKKMKKENYCLSSGLGTLSQPVTTSDLGSPLNRFLTPLNRQASLHKSMWEGKADLCLQSGCPTTLNKLQMYNFDGNIYVNVLDPDRSSPAPGASTIKGSRYGYHVDLPVSAKLSVQNQVDNTAQTTWPNGWEL